MTQKFLAYATRDALPNKFAPRLAQALAELGCTERWSASGLTLLAGDDLPLRLLANGEGFVIGHVFDQCGAPAAARLDAELSPAGAESIVGRVWGSYVALAQAQERLRALRDPSGGLACYHASVEGIHFFTSVPHLLVDSGIMVAKLDLEIIVGSLMQRRVRTSATALVHIRELLPGELMSYGPGGTVACQAWDPWRAAASRSAGDPVERLEQVLASTLAAWARCTARPLIEVSGGLDSAIVAAGVAAGASQASLITFSAAPGDPDETTYARAIAEHLGLELEIAAPSMEEVDLTRSLSADLPRPNARAFTQATDALSLRRARAIGADCFFSGGGGDDVFCYLRTILPAVDRLRAEGWRAMATTAHDIALINHSTLWDAFARIARRLLRQRSAKSRIDLRFLSAELAGDHSVPKPSQAGVALGKADHIRGVMTIHNDLEGHARAQYAPIISPLLSQPIVECCLSIPTWLWCEKGCNRAVARRAFAGRLPKIVIDRRSKGAFDGFCARLLETNRELLRGMLIEGRLAGQGLLDQSAVSLALRDPFPPADTVARLLALADVESWTQSWSARQSSRR